MAGPFGQAGLGDQADDVGVGADHLGVAGPDQHLGAGYAGSQHRGGLEGPAPDGEGDQFTFDQGEIGPGVDQAAEGHVTGDAGKAVPPGDGRHRTACRSASAELVVSSARGPRMRATAQAAPKPLSMPTTTSPEAQEASMARRAVTPSSPAP